MNDIPNFNGNGGMVFLPYNSIGSRHERQIGEIGDYGLECCIVGKTEKPPFPLKIDFHAYLC